MDDRQMRERVARIESLLGELEARDDDLAIEVVQALLELYGEGLARTMDAVSSAGDDALSVALARDEVVSHLLLLHGLHPMDVESRVRQALEEVRPHLASHGGNAELDRVEDGVAHLRMQGSCARSVSSTAELRAAIEEAIQRRAPDLVGIEAEAPPPPAPALVQIGPKPEARAGLAP